MNRIILFKFGVVKRYLELANRRSNMLTAGFVIGLLFPFFLNAQSYKQTVWCFGDSAKIDFNQAIPQTGQSSVRSRGTSVTIADSLGNIMFYACTQGIGLYNTGIIYSNNDSMMMNGDSIIGQAWYNEFVIIPNPGNANLFYLFSIGVTSSSPYGLYYSVIDMTLNSGLGGVVQKNVQLLTYPASDCLSAIQHGNGGDWWLFFRRGDLWTNNEFYVYLIDSSGVTGPNIQTVGTFSHTNAEEIVFESIGNAFILTNSWGLIDHFNFDRCTGIISNPRNIESENSLAYFGSALSRANKMLYVMDEFQFSSTLWQYDLSDTIGQITPTSIFTFNFSDYPTYFCGGKLRLAPDSKIYLSNIYQRNGNNFPYDDSVYNFMNMNLSVINSPDSPGVACDFQPYSFYLGGKRTYWGLPNQVNYELPAWGGSICDTLGLPNTIGNHQLTVGNGELHVYFHSGWQTAFVNASGLKGRNYALHVIDLSGREIITNHGKLSGEYFTQDLRCDGLSSGLYLILFETEKERLVSKFIIE